MSCGAFYGNLTLVFGRIRSGNNFRLVIRRMVGEFLDTATVSTIRALLWASQIRIIVRLGLSLFILFVEEAKHSSEPPNLDFISFVNILQSC